MPIGIESAHGFGDICFNICLIRELKKKHNDQVYVATRPHCKDALYNVPWVDKIIEIPHMWHGIQKLKEMGCDPVFQITQNVKFYQFRESDPNHSLIQTPLLTGRELHINDFDNRPMIFLDANEQSIGNNMKSNKPTIAIESVYKSAQSWADKQAFNMIIRKYAYTHRILWLSNEDAPNIPAIDNMLRFTRRQCIACLRAVDIFFSVGSGFFCSSLALDSNHQPKKIICLWTDDLYKYEEPLSKYKWHHDITWVHNHNELDECLNQL